MQAQNSNEKAMEEEEDYDELEELGLFHSSSLREPSDPPLPALALQTWQLKKTYGKDNCELYNQYELMQQLGKGAFGSVVKVRADGQQLAMKINSLYGLEKQRFFAADGEFANSLDILKNELNILKRLSHPNISRCLQIIHGSDKICTINQLGTLGQIMDWMTLEECYKRNQKVVEYMGEKYKTNHLGDITRIIFIQICQAVKYLHQHQITNRDIKVDNILCRETKEVGNEIIVVDFTTVRYKGSDDKSYFPTGTPGFRGPEHQFAGSQGYSCKATDVWAVGIAIWTFYHNKMPFPGEDDFERDVNAKNMQLQFQEDCPQIVAQVIKKMTRKDCASRISIEQALQLLQQH